MKTLVARYKVKPEKLNELLPIIKEFIRAAQNDTEHVDSYTGYQFTADPTRFMHMMRFTSPENEQSHSAAVYTLQFVDALYKDCEEQPAFEEIVEQ
jgi:quinol monooxygenase YgiN